MIFVITMMVTMTVTGSRDKLFRVPWWFSHVVDCGVHLSYFVCLWRALSYSFVCGVLSPFGRYTSHKAALWMSTCMDRLAEDGCEEAE